VKCLTGTGNDDTNLIAGNTDDSDELAGHYELFKISILRKVEQKVALDVETMYEADQC